MSLAIGQPVPDFTLKSSKMEDVTLSAQRGKNVLLLFIPLAFTST
jgi:peroxiredoxin